MHAERIEEILFTNYVREITWQKVTQIPGRENILKRGNKQLDRSHYQIAKRLTIVRTIEKYAFILSFCSLDRFIMPKTGRVASQIFRRTPRYRFRTRTRSESAMILLKQC